MPHLVCGIEGNSLTQTADRNVQFRELLTQPFRKLRNHNIFRAEMIGVDQVHAQLLRGQEAIVFHICSDHGVTARRIRKLQHIAAGASANRKL